MKTKLIILLLVITSFAKAQYTNLLNFNDTTNGSYPYSSLISDGTFLYGMTTNGGTNQKGTVFKIKPDGTGYVTLLDFAGSTNGSYPYGALISDGTFLYGMTTNGGVHFAGTIFKIKLDGTGYVKLLDFDDANGNEPGGSLFFDGTFLYGTTAYGGINGIGTIFKILPDGTGFTTLLDFDGTANGGNPRGTLISDGTFLYGTTEGGGIDGLGTIFKIKSDGTGYATLLDFDGTTNGIYPNGSLISDGTFLYGMTNVGGTNDEGTIFKIQTNGTGYVTLLNFNDTINGKYPYGSLISDGTFLYGMTAQGGTNEKGTVFKIKPDGTGYITLLNFDGATHGSSPLGSLILDGTFLYGMAKKGGTNGYGTIFKYQYCSPVTFSQSLSICAGQSVTVGSNTYTATGTYTDVLIAINGCDSTVTTNLVVNPLPSITVNSGSICEGNSFTITPSGADTYTYSGGSDIVNPTSNMSYSVVGTDANGCENFATSSVTVNALPTITVNSGTICEGNSFTITPSGASTYTVSNGTTVVTPTTNTSYTVTGTDANGCINNAVTTVTVNSNPTIIASTNSSLICVGETASLTVSGATSYTWNTTETTTLIAVSPTTTTNYTVNATDVNGCMNSATVTQSVSTCTSINSLAEALEANIGIYPNPFTNIITVVSNQINQSVLVYNTLGALIYSLKIENEKTEIDLSLQPRGVYFIKIGSVTKKIVKE